MDPISSTIVSPLVDCRGLICPAPILKVVEAVRRHRSHASSLTVLATDPEFAEDIEAWCRATRAELARLEHQPDGVIRAHIRLTPRSSACPPSRATRDLRPELQEPPSLVPTEIAPAPSGRSWSERLRTSHQAGASALRLACSERPAFRGATVLALRSPFEGPTLAPRALDEEREPEPAPAPEASSSAPLASLPTVEDSYPPSQPSNLHTLVRSASSRTTAIHAAISARSGPAAPAPLPRENRAALLVLHNDLEALLAALMIANAAAAQSARVEIYFAFWGIHLLRGERRREGARARGSRPGLLQRILLWLVPRGTKQRLGKLHLGGLGTRILLRIMRKRNILALDQLVDAAAHLGVRFRVCSMSMGLMGMTEDDIVDMPNVDFVGVASFAEAASRSSTSLVF